MANDRWKLRKEDGKIYGPVDTETIRGWIQGERIQLEDYLSREDKEEWVEAKSIPQFQGLFVPAAKATPPPPETAQCPKCGDTPPQGTSFCVKCGANLKMRKKVMEKKEGTKMAKIVWGPIIILVIGLGIAIYAGRRPEVPPEEAVRPELEVRFEGRTLQEWKRELDNPSVERRIAAVRAAREFGIVGVPLFFKALGDDDHFIREMAEKMMEEQFQNEVLAPFDDIRVSPGDIEIIISMLKDDAPFIRIGAAFTLGGIAQRPQIRSIILKEAVPVLMEMLRDKEDVLFLTPYMMEKTVQMAAMMTLKNIDPELFKEAKVAVKKMREGDDLQMRRIAAKTLAKIEKIEEEQEMARRSACKSNLRQIGLALHMYALDWEGIFPECLSALFPLYIPIPSLFICPSAGIDIPERITRGNVNLTYEYIPGLNKEMDPGILIVYDRAGNHQGGRNALFIAGHVQWIPEEGWAATYQRNKELIRRYRN